MRTPMQQWLDPSVAGFWTCSEDNAYSPRYFSTENNGHKRRYENTLNDDSLSFPPGCNMGELTLQGMRQHYQLGNFYRNYLVDELGFLPQHLNKSLINLRSSRIERCIKSMQSFMSSFYPPETPGESLDIVTGTNKHEPLYPDYTQCSDLGALWDKWLQTDDFKRRRFHAIEVYGDVFDELNISIDDTNWMYLGDWLSTYFCGDQDIPEYVTEEQFNQAVKDIAYFSYGFFNYTPGMNGASIYRLAFRDFDAFINGSTTKKFNFYSAHDSTIAACLNSLGISDEVLPPFRSHLTLELWQQGSAEPEIRMVYNGDVVNLKSDGTQLMKYKDFKSMLSESVSTACIEDLP